MEEVGALEPGENATLIPERWCAECKTPRPKSKCSLCGGRTVEATAEQIEAHGMGKRRDQPAPAVREVAPPEDMDTELERLRQENAASAARIAELEGGATAADPEPELEEPEEPAAPLAPVAQGNGWGVPTWSAAAQREERAAQPPRREGTNMRSGNGQQQETDDMGRRVVVMGGRNNGQPESSTAGEVLRRMWKNDQIDRGLWCSMAGHAIVGTQGDAQKAAEAADALYFEMWERIHQDGNGR